MPPEAIEPFTCGLGYHYAVVTCRLPVRRLSCLLRVRRPLCLSFVELEITLDPSRLIIRIRIIAIPRVSSFAFGSSRSLASHRSHSDHRDPSRLIVRIRIIAILCASSFAFGSSRSPWLWEHPSPAPLSTASPSPSPSSWACPSFNSVSAGRTSREAAGALPF